MSLTGTTRTEPQGTGTDGGKGITLGQLEQLCDDPARDLPGGVNVRSILSYEADKGFFLSAQDGELVYLVTDDEGKQVRFRTIEAALVVLQVVSSVSLDIGVCHAGSGRQPH